MPRTRFVPLYRRCLAGVLAALVGLGPLASPAYAAVTLLADQPLDSQNKAKPNILLTIDDSTSMLYDFLPDSVIGPYCRDISGKKSAACGVLDQNNDLSGFGRGKYQSGGYIFEQYGLPFGAYNSAFDTSGPGAGCDLTTFPTSTCSGGIDPAPSPVALLPWSLYPGIERYPNPAGPPPAKSPKAGQVYEYWTLWPAPAHNSELNHAYYNPRLTYEPPIDATGTVYPQMNAGNTSNWTRVPADPWATTVQYVDLTTPVTIGLWCNSDWSIGNEGDPAYCRTNGTGTSATTSSASTIDGDYNYPWAPPNPASPSGLIDPSSGPTTAQAIAWSKVDATHSNALTAAWTTAQDPKYYYENDNVLWCDATSPLWPQQGALQTQTCVGGSSIPQVCTGRQNQTCTAGTAQTCAGATPQTCVGEQTQTCTNLIGQVCNNAVSQVCNGLTPQTCAGVGAQTCGNISSQTCNGVTPQTCANITSQSCNNVIAQTCNLVAATCVPPPAASCSTTFDPPGCNLCSGECGLCTPVTTCPPGNCSSDNSSCTSAATCPATGTCSTNGNSCTSGAQCPTIAGRCSVDTGNSCMVASDCSNAGKCSTNIFQVCHADGDCATIPGHCTTDNSSCTSNATCVNEGQCTLTGTICQNDAACATQPGQCTVSHAGCFDNSQCPDAGGTCSVSGATCANTAQCPVVAGACNLTNQACTTTANCAPAGQCSIVAATCQNDGQCPVVAGHCSVATGVSCTADANCGTVAGHCTVSGNACTDDSTCQPVGQHCSMTGESCTSATYNPVCQPDFVTTCSEPAYCPIQGGACNIDGSACSPFFFNFPPFFSYDVGLCNPVNTAGHCSIQTGTVCYADFYCPPTPGPSGSAVCSDALSDNSKSLLDDANGAGAVCRHNNQTYGATVAARYNYPNAQYNTPVTAGTGVKACVASPRYATVPRHYWKTGLEWCDNFVGTAGDKWLGYGTPTGGSCQDSQDATHVYPRFYQFGQAGGTDNYGTAAFQRMDLDIAKQATATYTHNWTDDNGPESITRTFDGSTPDVSEMTNYANWFAYYRTRILAAKTVTSIVFNQIDTQYRVGFHNLFKLSSFVNIADFDAAQKATWYTQLFGITIPLGQQTPSLDALVRIGEYFKNGTHPQLAGSTDPITLSCQKNWHMFFTDGYTNQGGLPSVTVGDQDDTVPTYPDYLTNPIPTLVPSLAWPPPFREDPLAGASNGLSDYAMYYWITDLRTSGANATNNVPFSSTDPAQWQHLNFAALSLGTAGKLPAGNQSVTEDELKAGTLQWPQPYPNVYKPDNSGVDDLWHAAINGRGRFVNAQTPEEMALGMGQILQDALNTAGTRVSAGFQSNTLGATADILYRVLFEPGWSGSLAKLQTHVNVVNGRAVVDTQLWEASAQLTAQLQIVPGIKDTPWFTERRIITRKGDTGGAVPFLWTNLTTQQQDSLAPGNTLRGQSILEYLRGNRLKEGTKLGQLRVRNTVLGDIVDSSPVYVGRPGAPYLDGNDAGYSAFATSMSSRAAEVYVGANDGMLHAFDDTTGNETWAYIPSPLFVGGTAGGDPKTGLGALAYQDGALPPFRHHYYVDSTPIIVDADLDAPVGDQWRTLLVAGLGKGGNRYYALDVTQPADITSEGTAATKALWEFPAVGDTTKDIGYSYGKPMIAKTRAFGGAWVVIVGSGYDNVASIFPGGSGKGNLFIVNAATGALLKTMTTGVGSAASPSGLAHISGYTQDYRNQLVDQVYAADLVGNLWRFDMTDPDPNNWTVGQLASLVDAGGTAQPVTTPPEIKIDVSNGVDRWVFVGTGKLYDDSDLTTPDPPQQQTMYAIRDGTAVTPLPIPATPISRTTVGMTLLTNDITQNFGLTGKPDVGWFDDLPLGQRIIVPPRATVGVVAYIGTASSGDACLTGLPATIYARQYATGASALTTDPFGGTGTVAENIYEPDGGVGLQIVTFPGTTGASDVPDIRLAITLPSGDVIYFKANLTGIPFGHRMSWRLLGQ